MFSVYTEDVDRYRKRGECDAWQLQQEILCEGSKDQFVQLFLWNRAGPFLLLPVPTGFVYCSSDYCCNGNQSVASLKEVAVKVVVLKSHGFLGFCLRKMFGIKKLPPAESM